MQDLTQRQIEILKSLIEEYIATAEPVGSETLEKKHSLSASPATIRNEMVKLTNFGYLKKPHTSAGRVPTPEAMKFYVKQLMKEKELSVAEEVAVKEKVWDYREQHQNFLREMVKSLAEKTKTLAVAATDDGNFYYSGYANILEMPEFLDLDFTKTLLEALDESSCLQSIFDGIIGNDETYVLLGQDLAPRLQGAYGVVFAKYTTPLNEKGEIGVIGPTRLDYTYIVPAVRYYGHLIEEIAKGW
jgi:heat-inducible transcriptional repressor